MPAIRVAIALSLLIHAAVLWQWPPLLLHPSSETPERGDTSGSLTVQLVPRARRPPAPPSFALKAPRPRALQARPRPTPPVIALNKPAPDIASTSPRAPPISAPRSARPPADGDLASYVESRRRARGESAPSVASSGSVANAPPVEDENARANRIAAANLGTNRKPTFGPEKRGGGVFSIQRMGYDYAEFLFYGWNKDIRRNTQQLIEVRKGSNSDIRIAVVRRMIAIIREYEDGDFVWESERLGRNVTLSARARDNAGLEEFMMREFF